MGFCETFFLVKQKDLTRRKKQCKFPGVSNIKSILRSIKKKLTVLSGYRRFGSRFTATDRMKQAFITRSPLASHISFNAIKDKSLDPDFLLQQSIYQTFTVYSKRRASAQAEQTVRVYSLGFRWQPTLVLDSLQSLRWPTKKQTLCNKCPPFLENNVAAPPRSL